jgi:hypothetical protein
MQRMIMMDLELLVILINRMESKYDAMVTAKHEEARTDQKKIQARQHKMEVKMAVTINATQGMLDTTQHQAECHNCSASGGMPSLKERAMSLAPESWNSALQMSVAMKWLGGHVQVAVTMNKTQELLKATLQDM